MTNLPICEQLRDPASVMMVADHAADVIEAMREPLKEAYRALLHYEWFANPKSGWALPENTSLRGQIEAALDLVEGRSP